MADFDALIKQALKTQNSADTLVREKVYQSSRNALLRMLEKSGNNEAPAGKLHLAELEASIARIEQEYVPNQGLPADNLQPNAQEPTQPSLLNTAQNATQAYSVNENIEPAIAMDTGEPNISTQIRSPQVSAHVSPVAPPENDATHVGGQITADVNVGVQSPAPQPQEYAQSNDQSIHHQPENTQAQYNQADFSQSEIPPNKPQPELNYKRKSPILRRLSGLLFMLIILGVIAWLAYAFISNLSKPTNGAEQQKLQEQQKIDQSSTYLDVLTPDDPSALVTSGRGTAEVVTELNRQYLRIQSIRTSPNSVTNAEPILLEIQPGVLQKIAGKSVTIEIRTKSGNAEDGLFSVQCLVSGKSVCDRKRFPVGQQPENVIFALNLSQDAVHGDTFLAINTDVKSTINTSGAGSPIDILYVRVRISK